MLKNLFQRVEQAATSRVTRRGTRNLVMAPMMRSGAGKTALNLAKLLTLESEFFPASGLRLDDGLLSASDREKAAQVILQQARSGRMISTMQRINHKASLFDGDSAIVETTTLDIVGQLLTETKSDSDSSKLAQFEELVEVYSTADVIWAGHPIMPTEATEADEERFRKDLRDAARLLHASLAAGNGKPRTVCIVLTKLDSLFTNEASARAELKDTTLLQMLAPIVNVCRRSQSVTHAAIIPTSAFGFGKARIESNLLAKEESYHGEGEVLAILEGKIKPFNVDTLLFYSLAKGIANLRDRSLGEIESALESDIDAVDGWMVPIKG